MSSDKRYRLYECLIVFAIALKYYFAISLQQFVGPLPREYILGIVANFASETLAIHVLIHFLSRVLVAMEQRRAETIRKEWEAVIGKQLQLILAEHPQLPALLNASVDCQQRLTARQAR